MSVAQAVEDYAAIVARRRWYFLVPFVLFLAAGLAAAFLLPATYRSEGKIGVESQQIPEEFVRSTITTHAGERVGLIQQQVMTSARLEQIIDDNQLYVKDRQRQPMHHLVEKLRKRISLEVISDPFAQRLGAIAFTVGFENTVPQKARDVAAQLVDLFLEENTKSRTERAAETTEFLEREAEKLGEQARALDAEIAAFKQEHRDALPEHLDLKMGMLDRAESELTSLERELSSLQEQQRFLETQRASVQGGLVLSDGMVVLSSTEQKLADLKAEQAEMSAQYLPAHPEMRRLRAAVAALERQVRADRGTASLAPDTPPQDPALAKIDSELRSVASRQRLIEEQRQDLRATIDELQAQVIEIPQVEVVLRQLTDQYNLYMQEYSEVRSKKQDAKLAQSLEQQEKAERFVLLEAPAVPQKPERSLRKMLALALFLAVGGAGGIAYAAELLDDRIYGRRMLASVTGQPPLAVIPYLPAPADEAVGGKNALVGEAAT